MDVQGIMDMDMGGKKPFDYQARAVIESRILVAAGKRKLILMAPTGAGKTLMSCILIKLAEQKGKKILFLAPRRVLIRQTSAHLWDCGVNHGIICAGWELQPEFPVQVASKDTLASRTLRRERIEVPFCDIVVIDECHLSLATEHLKLLYAIEKKNPQCVFVGLSATPGRNDGKGMGDFYDALVNVARYDELIARKRLVPCKAFAPDAPNMRGVKQKEWDQEAAKRMDVPKLVGDVVQHWIRLGEDRPTVVFAANIAHSLHLRDEFVRHGISCEHIDQSTEEVDREAVLGRLEDGSTKVVTNCDLLSAGWDQPSVSCCVLACPSRSLTRYRQRAGRTFRVFPGKEDALLIDHSGGIFMHGFPDEDIEWPLDKSHSIDRDYQEQRNQGKTREPMVCPKCYTIFSGRSECPSCGNKFTKRGRDVAIAKGLLKEVKRTDTAPQREHMTLDDRKKYWKKCIAICVNQGKNCKAAAAMYSSKVGEQPWESGISGLPSRSEWSLPAAKVFPQFVR